MNREQQGKKTREVKHRSSNKLDDLSNVIPELQHNNDHHDEDEEENHEENNEEMNTQKNIANAFDDDENQYHHHLQHRPYPDMVKEKKLAFIWTHDLVRL